MPEVMHSLVSNARKKRFSSLPKLTEDEIIRVWDSVSDFVEFQMCSQKGVHIPSLGTFTFIHKRMDFGNNRHILIQRPVFVVSEKFAQTHALVFTKQHTTGEIPIVQLNFTALSLQSAFDRDTVEACVREVLQALSRAIATHRSVEFLFRHIGILSIKDCKVKMKFFKDFLSSMDVSGSLLKVMENDLLSVSGVYCDESGKTSRTSKRPSTAESRVSDDTTQSTHQRQATTTVAKLNSSKETLPVIRETSNDELNSDSMPTQNGSDREMVYHRLNGMSLDSEEVISASNGDQQSTDKISSSSNSHAKTTKANKLNFNSTQSKTAETPHSDAAPTTDDPSAMNRSASAPPQNLNRRAKVVAPLRAHSRQEDPACSSPNHHHRAGQELCYLCMQKRMRNVPDMLNEERRRKEVERSVLLQQHQQMTDRETALVDKAYQAAVRQQNQKTAAFNRMMAESKREARNTKNTEVVNSYLFQNRPLTPMWSVKPEEYSKALDRQIQLRLLKEAQEKQEQELQERLEQVQLAEELAEQREQFLRTKAHKVSQYNRALSAQIRLKKKLEPEEEIYSRRQLTVPTAHFIKPFDVLESTKETKNPKKSGSSEKAEVERKESILGRFASNNEKIKERTKQLLKQQLEAVSEKKKMMILRELIKEKEENDMLERTKRELIADRIGAHKKAVKMRKSLEMNWKAHHLYKLQREQEEKMRMHTPGMLLLQQTEKYGRCGQCQRRTHNCGESSIWMDSRYIPGSRLMV